LELFWFIGISLSVVIAIGIIIAVVSHKLEKKRTEQLAQVAAEMGFTFEPAGDALLASGLGTLPLFNRGHSRKTKNVLRKLVRGTEIIVLDHQYTVGSGKNQRTCRHTAVVFHPTDRGPFVEFEMRPERFFHKVGSLFGYRDIDFETHPKLSKRYLIRGPDESAVRSVFAPAVLDYFENSPGHWSIEARSAWIMFLHENPARSFRVSSGPGRVDPSEIAQFLAEATKVYLLFDPNSATREHTGSSGSLS
jgi:hypothetical protein